ncbi:MAG: exopolyphosphatase [Clostridia bacterium]|jgi:exopolyphosphatase/guanosine-5'-triphosphate,3'-diphosphate pyrophosphatase|nr:exopolyphosphatase [Clostridia bacterium]
MKNIGIIDLGSNSTRLLIVRLLDHNGFKVIHELKEAVRLGKDMGADGCLNAARKEVAMKTLQYFISVCETYNTHEIIAVATAAVRAATDKEAFLEEAKIKTGLDIRVLSGEEEAFYDYFGIVNSISFTEGLIIDIGGASTEIIYVQDRAFKECISLPFGAITLTEKFGLTDDIKEENLAALRTYLIEQYDALPWLSQIKDVVLIGVGGTLRNIGKIDRKLKEYSLDRTHHYKMDTQAVEEITCMVGSMSLKQRRKLKGLSKTRADIFVAACEAVKVLTQYCRIKKLIVSGNGVKEGLLYEYIQGEKLLVRDVLEFSTDNLMQQYQVDKERTDQIWRRAKYLLDFSKSTYDKVEDATKILRTAVMLHRIGVQVSCYDFHKHSFYMMLHADLNGLSHREILMVAYTILYHPKEEFENLFYGYKDLLGEQDISMTQKLGVILKMAINNVVF